MPLLVACRCLSWLMRHCFLSRWTCQLVSKSCRLQWKCLFVKKKVRVERNTQMTLFHPLPILSSNPTKFYLSMKWYETVHDKPSYERRTMFLCKTRVKNVLSFHLLSFKMYEWFYLKIVFSFLGKITAVHYLCLKFKVNFTVNPN